MKSISLTCAALALASVSAGTAFAEDGAVFTNSIGMAFIPVAAGSFRMGSPDTDRNAQSSEKPQHQVSITRPFLIGKFEVTQAQWTAVIGSSSFDRDRSNPFYNLPGMAERITKPHHPANVSWNDAQEFLAALNAREGHKRYRLPTEAEWEYVARAGTPTAYSFGDAESDLGRHAWFGEDFTSGGSHPVGSKKPNPWGLYDVHGNVWEWVQDWYAADYYTADSAIDPKGPETGAERVVRGGSWHVTGNGWRSAFRRDYDPDYRGISIGFRVVMDTDETNQQQ